MSNLDPFTQKLLERTQARKEAAKNKRQGHLVSNSQSPLKPVRAPLVEKNEHNLSPEKSRINKRHSSEGLHETSFEKKLKTNTNDVTNDEELFSKKQNTRNAFVVPSNAGRTPKKLTCGSLANRLASLRDDYNEKFQLDLEEQRRHNEAITSQEERKKEHLRMQEEERARRIQEKIFGKNHVTQAVQNEAKSQSRSYQEVTSRPPLRTTSSSNNEEETQHAVRTKFFEQPRTTTDAVTLEKQKQIEERTKRIIKDRKSGVEEAKRDSASVNDKMSIFEKKMKEEREAREKEIEAENRLRQKFPRNPVVLDVPVTAMCVEKVDKIPEKLSQSSEEEDVEIDPMMQDLKSPCPGKGETGMLKHVRSYSKNHDDLPELLSKDKHNVVTHTPKKEERKAATPKKMRKKAATPRKEAIRSETPKKEERSKNYTGDLNSPQPVDCTEDTELTESKAFDISEILKVAEREKLGSPTKTPIRSSTMKAQWVTTPVVQPLLDIDVTPVRVDEDEDDEPSQFAKQIRNRKEDMKAMHQSKEKAIKIEVKKERPQKPPRISHSQTDFPPTYQEYIASKEGKNIIDDDYIVNKPDVAKPVEITSRKKLRRSVSFSEGQSPATTVQSGYNKQRSSKYDACSSFDKPDIVYSKRDQIQNLLEEAANQQNIVLQTSQALNVAESCNEDKRGSPEVIEGERLLLLATEKRTACLEEVRVLKETDSVQFLNELDTSPPCKATLALTEIKLPLHHDFVTALRGGRMDLGIFHFVIIVSCGSRNVFSTKVVSSYDEMESYSLLLNSNLFMRNIPHDFTLSVKVFGLHTKKGNDPHSKVKRTYTTGQSPGNLKHLFSKKKEEEYSSSASPQTVFRTSSFKLIGETKINLALLGNGSKHVLNNVPSNCPIEGFVQLRVGCKPEFTATASGFLTVLEDVGGYTAWNRRWCNMKDNKILYWRYPDDEETKEPLGCIDLRFCTDQVVKVLARDKCARPHTFELNTKRTTQADDEANLVTTVEGRVTIKKHWVCADNKDDRVTWMEAVNKQLSDSRAWLLKNATKKSSKPTDILSSDLGRAVAV